MTFRYNDRIKAWLVRTILLALFIAYLSSTFIYLMELPLDLKKECDIWACVVPKYRNLPQLFVKLFIGTMNIICSGFFFYLVRHSSSTVKNRTVKATVLSEIFLNVIPAFIGYFFNQVIKIFH
uniref:Uncharacterized protein n=1 Tax=Ditylenchus dipsaci TaxID=166011 RepID=A0A915D9C2_9BILA